MEGTDLDPPNKSVKTYRVSYSYVLRLDRYFSAKRALDAQKRLAYYSAGINIIVTKTSIYVNPERGLDSTQVSISWRRVTKTRI